MTDPKHERAIITNDTLVISLTPKSRANMEQCLKKSGKVVLKLDKVEFTNLPGVGSLNLEVTED